MKKIRVFAVDGRSLPFEGGVGRFVARDKKGAALLAGDEVPATSYYHRAISRGDIALSAGETPSEGEKENAS